MGPKPQPPHSGELCKQVLEEMIDLAHPLAKLSRLIDWELFEREWLAQFASGRSRPASSGRLVAGLLYLQHTFGCSDEALIRAWVENPYWQYFCGESHFQHRAPVDASSLSR
jgi:IS5 family transposase